MEFNGLYAVIATLFILMIVGFVCRKTGIINDAVSKHLSALILKIGQPCMIISALAEAEYSVENLQSAGIIVCVGFVLFFLLAILAFFICKPYKVPDERKITEFSLIFTNCGFIGFPVFESLFPGKGLFLASFFVISFHILIWSWGIAILARNRSDIKLTIRKIIFNFGTVPCAIGFLLYILKAPGISFQLPQFALLSLKYLSNLCTPISVIITGALIATQSFSRVFKSPKIPVFCLLKLVVLPMIICLIVKLIRLPEIYAMFAIVAAALPSASTITMFSESYDLDSGFSSLTVGISSLLSVVTLPLVTQLSQMVLSL